MIRTLTTVPRLVLRSERGIEVPFSPDLIDSYHEEAARFAALNGARIISCSCPIDHSWEPRTVEVRTERVVEIWPLGVYRVHGVGRAEFVLALLLADP
ncbi:MAG: hypothetical protein Q8Q29_07865 [Actinomycetota bacterium]|nr:hypothetical protein [Actinomycetota bacterium]